MLNLTEIAARIKQPEISRSEDIDSLKQLCERYPFSQTFPLLYLKALAQTNDVRLDQELQNYAYRITDRSVLYDLLYAKASAPLYKEEKLSEAAIIAPIAEEIPVKQEVEQPQIKEESKTIIASSEQSEKAEEINTELVEIEKTHDVVPEIEVTTPVQPAEDVLPETPIEEGQEDIATAISTEEIEEESVSTLPSLPDELLDELSLQAPVYSLEAEEKKREQEEKEQERQRLIEALTQKKTQVEVAIEKAQNGPKSFTSWLHQSNSSKPKIEAINKEISASTKQEKKAIIDQFIENKPKISIEKEKLFEDRTDKNEFFNPTKKAKESLDDTRLPVSETLAKIFVAQGNFSRAIYAYEQLMLIFPEKKLYFASLIEDLTKKINT
jgi:hypothetical protein